VHDRSEGGTDEAQDRRDPGPRRLLAAFGPVSTAGASDGSGEADFEGVIQSLPATPGFVGDWLVSGRIVHVTTATEIKLASSGIVVGPR